MSSKHAGKIGIYGFMGLKNEIPCTRVLMTEKRGTFPSLTLMPDGEIISMYRGENNHVGEGTLLLSRSRDGGLNWNDPVTVFSKPGMDVRNQCIGLAKNGNLACLYTERISEPRSWKVFQAVSEDQGKTWESKELPEPNGYHWISPYTHGNILQRRNGDLLTSCFSMKGTTEYVQQEAKEYYSFILISKDNGYTWEIRGEALQGWTDEVDFTENNCGDLLAYIRGGGRFFGAIWLSYDLERSTKGWSEPRMVAFDGLSPAISSWITNEDMLLTVGCRQYPYGARGIVSHDSGYDFSWDSQIVFSDTDGDGKTRYDNGYPSTVILPDGYAFTAWYRSKSIPSNFEGTEDYYCAEGCRYKIEDLMNAL